MKDLVLVESPAKASTIEKYLENKYQVLATYGHVRDLPTKEIGIDFENSYEPKYEKMKGKSKVISDLKKAMKDSKVIYLAVDPDREGEAIGWHVAQSLGLITKKGAKKKGSSADIQRIVFHEITKDAVREAMSNPRKIDMDLVNAQQARRVLDRIVGYKLSPLLWKKVRYGLSAGRVQSVAVRLVVDRERERQKFKAEEFWNLVAHVNKKKSKKTLDIIKLMKDDEKIVKTGTDFEIEYIKSPKDEKASEKILKELGKAKWVIKSVNEKDVNNNPPVPFITSTLQRAAMTRLGFGSSKTMREAQILYEKGLITYMRTDSLNVSKQAITACRKYISSEFGKKFLSPKERVFKTKSKVAQEAHEAIRPTDYKTNPSMIKVGKDAQRLYELIWKRAIASQMASAIMSRTKVVVMADDYEFNANGSRVAFEGYLKLYNDRVSENILPELKAGEQLFPSKILGIQKFTQPPARYNEASLIKALEADGIGRPSTYAAIMTVIVNRGYVIKEAKYLVPTDVAFVVIDLLVEHFPDIVNVKFTAGLEDDLDNVANGDKDWVTLIDDFYKPFEKTLNIKDKELKKEDFTKLGESEEKCPECGAPMNIKLGKFGKFLSCSKFPECKGMKSMDTEEELQDLDERYESAPKSKDSKDMVLKTGRFGKFWAHPDYPKVKEVAPLLLKEKCPECGSGLVERKGRWGKTFTGCSGYPNCKYIQKKKKED